MFGRLRTEGLIEDAREVLRLEIDDPGTGTARASVQVPDPRLAGFVAERAHRRETGCGLLHWVDCAPASLHRDRPVAPPEADTFRGLFRELFAAADRESPQGGVHAAALSDGERLRAVRIDIGRHNAVDRVIGAALMDALPLESLGLIVTSRISGEIARKAACSGVAWTASRSMPSTLAVRIAAAAGLPLVARAARGGPFS